MYYLILYKKVVFYFLIDPDPGRVMNALKTHRFVLHFPLPPPPPPFFTQVSVVAMSSSPPLPQVFSEQLRNYPRPLSPPLPAASKQIELSRALSASSRSDLHELSEGDIVYEDEWLLVVNKPRGIYCESVLKAAHRLFTASQAEDGKKFVLLGFYTISSYVHRAVYCFLLAKCRWPIIVETLDMCRKIGIPNGLLGWKCNRCMIFPNL